ncbi:MAG: hypothetical protein ACPHUF_03160 [Gammaproteobacteria bacterium]
MTSVHYMEVIRERYEKLGYTPYRWYQADDAPPWSAMEKPLTESKLGVVSTSGAYALGQVAYHYKDDTSIRAIPTISDTENLRFSHITENYLVSPKKDPNCILPLAQANTLVDEGTIGSIANNAFSCMGGVYSQRRVREEVAPALHEALLREQIDCALLVAM